jgi:hypothetical protein
MPESLRLVTTKFAIAVSSSPQNKRSLGAS